MPASNHEAFELFLRESDRGVLTRAEATEAVAALTSIATGSSPTLLPEADRAVLELAARDAVLAVVADEIVIGPEAAAGVVGGCVALIGHFLVIGTPSGERVVREYESGVALQDAWINNIAVARAADHLG
ncbi:MAG: hypothetical protein NTW76_19480 [Corynebacteriales bacterium]|nr:hypothetical protein [Mycobacteriales bacterium]